MNSKVRLNRQTVVRLALVGIIPLILFYYSCGLAVG